jgi:hypothetical protein
VQKEVVIRHSSHPLQYCMQNHGVEAPGSALSVGALEALGEGQEPGACGYDEGYGSMDLEPSSNKGRLIG